MARAFQFDVDIVVEQLNRILQMELAAVIYYTHYSFMIYGHARIPITSWLRDNATESLAHAQEAGQMIMRLHKRPALGIAALPTLVARWFPTRVRCACKRTCPWSYQKLMPITSSCWNARPGAGSQVVSWSQIPTVLRLGW